MKIKICGINDDLVANTADDQGVDYLGFIFEPKSPRYVTPNEAADIAHILSGRVRCVGVFTTQSVPEIQSIAANVGFDIVQLHGSYNEESVRELKRFGCTVWLLDRADLATHPSKADAILVDSHTETQAGGTGLKADWSRVAELKRLGYKVILAGGLSTDNLAAAMATGADVLDLNSSLEVEPGKKDPDKVTEALAAYRHLRPHLLQRISDTLARETPWFITAIAVLTFFIPSTFSWVHGNSQTAILGLIMLAMGMTLTTKDFKVLASHPLDIALGSLAQFTLMPLIAFSLTHLLGLPRGVAVGLILVGCCPGGVSSNIMSFLCKGDVAFSVGITTLSTLFAPLTTPLLMMVLAGEMVEIDAIGMFKSVLLVTLMPVGLGFLFNRLWGTRKAYREVMKVMPGVAVIALACIVGGVVAAQGNAIVKSGALIFVGVFLHNSLGYLLGYTTGVVSRFSQPKRRTISIEVGMQNAGLATVLASQHFPMLPEAAVASAVSCVWHSISGALLAGLFNAADRWLARK